MTAAVLRSGELIEAEHFVNAAGAWAKDICAMAGFAIPIEPLRRYEHFFECQDPIEPRFPQFERTRCIRTMAGLYDQNDFDGNVIIGPGADGLGNFHLLAGFSGHGLMHAPGCGRAMAELLVKGRYESIDLARLGWQRVLAGQPLREEGII